MSFIVKSLPVRGKMGWLKPGNRYKEPERNVNPRLLIDVYAWQKLMEYVKQNSPNEINGCAFIQREGNDFLLSTPDDVRIMRQTVTPGGVDNEGGDPEALAKMVSIAVAEDRMDQMKMQWHSHPGSVYLSTTDTNNIENLGKTANWMVSLVVNEGGHAYARFDQFVPTRLIVKLDVKLYIPSNPALTESVAEEIERLVTVQKRVRPAKQSGGGDWMSSFEEQLEDADFSATQQQPVNRGGGFFGRKS